MIVVEDRCIDAGEAYRCFVRSVSNLGSRASMHDLYKHPESVQSYIPLSPCPPPHSTLQALSLHDQMFCQIVQPWASEGRVNAGWVQFAAAQPAFLKCCSQFSSLFLLCLTLSLSSRQLLTNLSILIHSSVLLCDLRLHIIRVIRSFV